MNASLTSQCISSRRVSAGSASLHVDHNPCSFVSARRSGEHGAVGGGRSRSTPEGHTAWPSSASRSIMLQSRLWSSLRPVTSAHSKLRARTPPALHHCLAEAVVINFCPAGVSRQLFMLRQSASRCCYAEQPFQSASGAGSTVAGRRRGNRCAAAAPPQPIYACALSPRAVCTLCRSVLATSFDPSNDQGLSDGLRFSLHTLVCGSRGRAWSFRGARSPRSRRKHLACEGFFVYVCTYGSSGSLWS